MSNAITAPESADQARLAKTGTVGRIRVVHLVSTLDIGGLEKVVFDLVRLANRDTINVSVACLGEAGALARDFEMQGIEVASLRVLGRGKLQGVREVARFLKSERPDVLHTHNPSPHFQGALAAWISGVPVVVHTKHGRNYPDQWRKVWANRVATCFSRRVVAVSGAAADVARDIECTPPIKVEVLHNGIDLDQFSSVGNSQPRDPRRAIHVARICDPPKDHGTLLRAIRRVLDVGTTFHLDIVGDGPQRSEIEQLCSDLKLENNVKFWGFRSNVQELLACCGLFLLSTTTEGLSITILEAMANSMPVVTTRVGGNPEAVADGVTGLLVPVGSDMAMADAILQMTHDPNQALQMGEAGRKRVEQYFDVRNVVARYESLYFELLAQRRRRWV